MKNKYTVIILLLIVVTFIQCNKSTTETDPVTPTSNAAITDDELFNMTNGTDGYTYYKGSSDIATSAPASAHSGFYRVRFNATAQAALTDNGKLPEGGTFPEGSIIVKELHKAQDGSNQNGIAIMIKRPNDPNAGSNGWVWAEYFGSTANAIPVDTKGAQCIGCHSSSKRDMVRLFELVP